MLGLPVFGQLFHRFFHVFWSFSRFCNLGPFRWSWGTLGPPFGLFWRSWNGFWPHFGALGARWGFILALLKRLGGLLLPKLCHVCKNIQFWEAKVANFAPIPLKTPRGDHRRPPTLCSGRSGEAIWTLGVLGVFGILIISGQKLMHFRRGTWCPQNVRKSH